MTSPAKFQFSKPPTFHPKINLERRSLVPVIRASSSSNHKPSLLKTTLVTLTTSAALFSASFNLISKPALGITVVQDTIHETQFNNVETLLSLAKVKFDSKDYDQTIAILNRLIEMDPKEQQQWKRVRARVMYFSGKQSEAAIRTFKEMLAKDPIHVEAYHYLVMDCCHSKPELTKLEKGVKKAIGICEKQGKKNETRDLKMLTALIKLSQGKVSEAVEICQVLLNDDPGLLVKVMVCIWKYMGLEGKRHLDDEDKLKAIKTMDSQWGAILAFDPIHCYLHTVVKLWLASDLSNFEVRMRKAR